ncbi:MAG TPA: hypothetical protein VF628_13300 [Allosphingosinicella sp.]|jgi:hypothetical protein
MTRYTQKPFEDRSLAVLDIEAISGEQPVDGSFPPWPTFSPVVASVLQADLDNYGEWQFRLHAVRFGEDERPLEILDELISGRGLVTYNGSGFDLPVLMLTAQKARSLRLPALVSAATQPRYGNVHYDLAQRYSGYGSARGASLAMLCEALCIPAKFSAHGEDVGALYDEGEVEKIVQYCHGDVSSTLLLHAHHRALETGEVRYHASLTAQFARWVQEQDLAYLAPFAEVAGLADLLQQSLLSQISSARSVARINSEWQSKQEIDGSFSPAIRY